MGIILVPMLRIGMQIEEALPPLISFEAEPRKKAFPAKDWERET
jgi:hypothetical protein